MPSWAIYVFFAGMLICSAVTITGVVMEKFLSRIYGFYVEAAGLVALFFLCAVYAYWVFTIVAAAGANFILFMTAVSIASVWRTTLITLGLRRAKKVSS